MEDSTLHKLLPKKGKVEDWGEPISSPHAPSLEKFSMKSVSNPMVKYAIYDAAAAQKLYTRMQQLMYAKFNLQNEMVVAQTPNGTMQVKAMEAPIPQTQYWSGMQEEVALEFEQAAHKLASEAHASSKNDLWVAKSMLNRFWFKFCLEHYNTGDLMSLLLLAEEEILWEMDGSKPPQDQAESDLIGLRQEISVRNEKASITRVGYERIPREEARREDIRVMLISIREMLKHYFEAYPDEYPQALAEVLGVELASLGDEKFVDERIAFAVSRVGTWDFAKQVWKKIMQKKGKDVDEDLDFYELGIVPPQDKGLKGSWKLAPRWGKIGAKKAIGMIKRILFG